MSDTILSSVVANAVLVVVPSAVMAVALAVAWPRFRRGAGALPMVLGVGGLALVWISDERSDGLLPWVTLLAGAGISLRMVQVRQRRSNTPYRRMMGTAGRAVPGPVMALIVTVAIAGVLGTSAQVARHGLGGGRSVSAAAELSH